MKTEPIRIALVGCGGMARKYRKKYTQIPGAELALVVDANEAVARQVGDELGVAWSTDFQDALAANIDMVDISTPNFLHRPQAVAALNAGKHLLLQKPMAPSLEEAKEIVDAAAAAKTTAGVYMSMLDNPVYYDIKRMMQEGLLGDITNISCRSAHRGGLHLAAGDWRGSVEKTGGGAFIQMSIHFINLTQWMMGQKIVRIGAMSQNRLCPGIGGDDITMAVCAFESGLPASFEACYASDVTRFSIYGTKGFVAVTEDIRVDLRLEQDFEGDIISYRVSPDITTIADTGYDELKIYPKFDQHVAFVKAAAEKKPAPVSLLRAFEDLSIVKAAYRSSQEGKWLAL